MSWRHAAKDAPEAGASAEKPSAWTRQEGRELGKGLCLEARMPWPKRGPQRRNASETLLVT